MKRNIRARYLAPVVGIAAALSLSGAALAANPPPSGQSGSDMMGTKQSSQVSNENESKLSGTVSSIDKAAETVTVKGLLLSKTFHANASTIDRLKVGEKVEVTYSKQGESFYASEISQLPENGSQPGSSASPSSSPSSAPNTGYE